MTATGIMAVTHPDAAAGVVAAAEAAVRAGVRSVQVRDKTASAAALLSLLRDVTAAVRAARADDARRGGQPLVLVDDRVDVFLAARAGGLDVDGVHLGQTDLPAHVARRVLDRAPGSRPVLGLTAHTPAHRAAVRALPPATVDYLGVGVIHPTATKPDHPDPLGVAGFARFAGAAGLPCVAIGGVTAADVGPLRRAGAAGVAVVSAITAASDPFSAARALVTAWDAAAVGDGAPDRPGRAGQAPAAHA